MFLCIIWFLNKVCSLNSQNCRHHHRRQSPSSLSVVVTFCHRHLKCYWMSFQRMHHWNYFVSFIHFPGTVLSLLAASTFWVICSAATATRRTQRNGPIITAVRGSRRTNYCRPSCKTYRACPCTLGQALADQGRFIASRYCDFTKQTPEALERLDYCFARPNIKHCVLSIVSKWAHGFQWYKQWWRLTCFEWKSHSKLCPCGFIFVIFLELREHVQYVVCRIPCSGVSKRKFQGGHELQNFWQYTPMKYNWKQFL